LSISGLNMELEDDWVKVPTPTARGPPRNDYCKSSIHSASLQQSTEKLINTLVYSSHRLGHSTLGRPSST
jgi:hypothetical protein